MALKELAGNRDIYDVMKKQDKKMKKQAEKLERQYLRSETADVFDFINKKLKGKKGMAERKKRYRILALKSFFFFVGIKCCDFLNICLFLGPLNYWNFKFFRHEYYLHIFLGIYIHGSAESGNVKSRKLVISLWWVFLLSFSLLSILCI